MKLSTLSYDRARGWSNPFPQVDSAETLLVVFGAASFIETPGPLAELRAAFPTSRWVGCSTSGEIHGTLLRDDSLTVAVAKFDSFQPRTAALEINGAADSFRTGSDLASRLERPDLRGVFVLSEGLGVNGSELVRGINSVLGGSVVVTGGLAGDGDRFKRTWVLDGSGPRSGYVTAVGLYGERVQIGHGSKGGWDKFGPARRVTRADHNVLYELDGRPALKLYKEYLGERAAELPSSALLFPLAVSTSHGDSKVLVRTVLAVDEHEQSMTFAGDVPEGSVAQLMRANFERLIDGASSAAQGAARPLSELMGTGAVLSIAISCVGRRLVLGERTEEEIEAALLGLPPETRQIGFYSYGEISPFATGQCDLHNQTMTLTTISEM